MNFVLAAVLGFAAAFVGSIPMAGPMAVLILDRALSGERREAWFTALGGALVEGLYAMGIALSLPLLMAKWPLLVPAARGAGAVIVGGIGLVLILKPTVLRSVRSPSRRASLLSGVTVAGLNPTLFASWAVVIGTLYAHGLLERRASMALPFAAGVTLGVTAWFSVFVWFSGRFARLITGIGRARLSRVFGVALLGAGLYLGGKTVAALVRPSPALLISLGQERDLDPSIPLATRGLVVARNGAELRHACRDELPTRHLALLLKESHHVRGTRGR